MLFQKKRALKKEIISIGRRLYNSRLVVAKGGNLSARVDKNNIFITATSTSLGNLRPEDIVKANLLNDTDKQNNQLSSEFPLHSLVYENFNAVTRVIHCHPPLTNAYFSLYDNIEPLTYETKLALGNIPVVKQFTPTITKPEEVIEHLKISNIVVIKNHGVVAISDNFLNALYLIEDLEEAVKMVGLARLLDKEKLNSFESQLKKKLSTPVSETKYEMFSDQHIQAIVDLTNEDKLIAQKGEEFDLTGEIAIKLQEAGKAYKFVFKKGKIIKLEYDDNAPFVISAPGDIWKLVFLGRLDPFVAITQGKMQLKGALSKFSRWYVPLGRLFELFREVRFF